MGAVFLYVPNHNLLSSNKMDLSIFKNEHIELLSNYKSYKEPLSIKCSEGHITSISMNAAKTRVNRGKSICVECAKSIKICSLTRRVENLLYDKGYKLLDSTVSYDRKVKYQCKAGHVNKMAISNIMNGKSCPECYGNLLKSSDEINKLVDSKGLKLIGQPKGSKTKFNCVCINGHEFNTSYNNLINNLHDCPKCSYNSTSKQEEELYLFIRDLYSGNILRNNRSLLAPKELDIVIPKLKIAIEYCGLYWHSDLMGKDDKYHLNKLEACDKIGYKLITIFEDEWVLYKDKCKSLLTSYINPKKMEMVYTSHCNISVITETQARDFCEENCIYNYEPETTVRLGAFLKNELVAVMIFSETVRSNEYELHNFCHKLYTAIPGIAYKLLSYFENTFYYTAIQSFVDRRWFSGSLYESLGFKECGVSNPLCYYFKNSLLRQYSPDLKNQIILNSGLNRIWDCGNFKYIKNK